MYNNVFINCGQCLSVGVVSLVYNNVFLAFANGSCLFCRYIEFQSTIQSHNNIDISAVVKVQVLAVTGDAGSYISCLISLFIIFSNTINFLLFCGRAGSVRKLSNFLHMFDECQGVF